MKSSQEGSKLNAAINQEKNCSRLTPRTKFSRITFCGTHYFPERNWRFFSFLLGGPLEPPIQTNSRISMDVNLSNLTITTLSGAMLSMPLHLQRAAGITLNVRPYHRWRTSSSTWATFASSMARPGKKALGVKAFAFARNFRKKYFRENVIRDFIVVPKKFRGFFTWFPRARKDALVHVHAEPDEPDFAILVV